MRHRFPLIAAVLAVSLSIGSVPAAAQQRALGIDVSAWQGDLSQSAWNSIEGDGLSFAFIRSSRGGTTGFYNQSDSDNVNRLNTYSQRYDDLRFANNITRATTAGMFAGPYHFGRMDIPTYELDGQAIAHTGTDEANHMLQRSGPYMKPGYLLPIFDLEAGSGIQTSEQLAQFAIAFSDRIFAVAGYRPGVYIGNNYSSPMNSIPSAAAVVAAYPVLWNARWPTSPNITTGNPSDYTSTIYGPWDNFGDPQPWHFWQYTSTGSVSGYGGNVDLDVAHGTIEYLKDHLVPALWMNNSSGTWSSISNWNSDNRDYNAADLTKGPAPRLPGVGASGANDTVILDRPSASITVTHGSGTTTNIRKLYVAETLNITGGSLTVNYDPTTTDAVGNPGSSILGSWAPAPWVANVSAEFNGAVTLSGNASLSVQKLQVDAQRTFTLAGGTLSFNTMNVMPHSTTPAKLAITGDITITPLNNAQANATATIANGSGAGTSGSVDLGNGVRTITVNDGTAAIDLLVSVPMTGSGGGFTKAGAGAMSLTGASTFTGAVAVNRGSVSLSGGGTVASASGYTVQGGATLTVDNSATSNGNRLASAPVTLRGGTLNFIGNTTTESTGNFTAAVGASTVALSGAGTSTLAFGSFTRSAGATVNFTGADSTHRATFTSGVTAANFIDQGTFVNGADYAVYNTGTNYVRAMVTGAGASDYATTVALGRHVKLSASAAAVASTSIKTLNLAGATVGLDLSPANTLTLTNGGILKSGGGVGSITGTGSSLTSGATEYVFNTVSASDELAVAVAVTNGTGLTKSGAGVLTLSNTGNNYAGTTTIAQGTLKLGASNVIPDSSNVVIGPGATLNMNSFNETVGTVTMHDGTIGSAGTLTLNGSSPTLFYSGAATGGTISTTNLALGTGAGLTTFDVADGGAAVDLVVSSVVQDGTGLHGLFKAGAGTLQLTGNNSFTGPVGIGNGILSVSSISSTALSNQPLGNSGSLITLGGPTAATLRYTGAASTTLNRGITIGGVGGGTIRTTTGALTIGSSGISGGGNAVAFDTAGANITVSTPISGTGTTVTKSGANTLTLSANNAYTGNTIINEGTLAYTTIGNLGTSNAIVFGGGALRTLAAVTESRGVTLNAGGGTIDTNGFSSTFSGVLGGAGGLTKIGTGTLTLSNTNTYTGTTSINAGTVSLTGTINAGSKVEINSGATLSGTGTVLGNAQVLGTGIINLSGLGTISGTLTAHGGNWNGTGNASSLVTVVGGSFTLGSGANLTTPSGVNVDGGALAGSGTVTGNVTLVNNAVNYSTVNFSSGGTINGTLVAGGGTAIWAGSGSVTGATSVNSGTLFVNGTLGGAGGLTVVSGAKLHGTGTINKALTLSGNNHVGGMIHVHGVGASSPTTGTLTINSAVTWGAAGLFITGGPVSTTGDTISGNLTIESPHDLEQNFDLNYTVSLGGTGTAAITTTGVLAGNGRVTKPVTITGGGIINLSSPPTLPTGGSTLTSTLTATGGNWNGQGTVSGLTSVASGTFTIGSGANLTANGNMTVSGTGAIAGTGTITGSVTYTSSAADTFAGVIAGASKTVTVNSTSGGVLTLTGASTYTGATTITAGTLQIGSGGSTGSIADTGGIVDNSVLVFNRSNAYTYSGVISGTGTVTKSGAGTVTLNGANTYTGGTTISAGTLQIGNGGMTGSLSNTGGIVNNSALTFNRSSVYTYGGVISGAGIMTKLGAATLTLTGANTYSGGTTISAGTLAIGSGGTTGSLAATGGIINNSALVFSRSNAYTYGGVISGTGIVTTSGTGTLTLTGTNTYAGNTTINSGVLEYSTSANLGSVSNSVIFNGGALRTLAAGTQSRNVTLIAGGGTIDTNGLDSTFSGNFSGVGALTKSGAGALTLTNNSSTYSGGTTVNAGKLLVNNTSGSGTGNGPVTVAGSGTLGGTGSISGAVSVDGTVAPGTSVGTLTTGNNVTMNANSHLAIELSGATADLLAVGGNFNLSAAEFLDVTGTGTGSSWVIATYAGTLLGTFDNITSGYTVHYGTGINSQITLNVAAAALPGDFNSDGKVDAGDYATWRKAAGGPNTLPNDNGLGLPVGQNHYDLWRANFGTPPGAGSGAGFAAGASVPEPAAAVMVVGGLLPLFWRRNRRSLA